MPPPSKRRKQSNEATKTKKRKCRSKAAIYKRNERESKKWQSELDVLLFHCKKLKRHNGKLYTPEENALFVRAIVACLDRHVRAGDSISWTGIDLEISGMFHVSVLHITWLRQTFLREGKLVDQEASKRGCGVGSSKNKATKVNEAAVKEIAKYVDTLHSKCSTVTLTKINAMLRDTFGVEVHQSTISRIMTRLGLSWAPIKYKPRTFAAHRHEHLRNYLIKLDAYTKEIKDGNKRELMFVFTDESYIHQNHQGGKTYLSQTQQKEGIDKKKKVKDNVW